MRERKPLTLPMREQTTPREQPLKREQPKAEAVRADELLRLKGGWGYKH